VLSLNGLDEPLQNWEQVFKSVQLLNEPSWDTIREQLFRAPHMIGDASSHGWGHGTPFAK
jgi:hypothetical protein